MKIESSSSEAAPARAQAFHAELLRPEDLLHLLVDGHNLRLRNEDDDARFLELIDPDEPAFLRFTFPPQTIAESAFFEAAITPGGDAIQPAGDPKAKPDPEAGSKVREPFPKPGFPALSARRTALLGRPSRLVFRVEPETRIPYSIEGLLDWSGLKLSVNGIAAIPREPRAAQIASAPEIKEPALTETAIELPYRLLISPNADVVWLHRAKPFTSRGRTELWHTRLALKVEDKIVELTKTDLASLRAIWSPDYDPKKLPAPAKDLDLGRTAMDRSDRHQIVVLTSAFHGYEVDRTFFPWLRAGRFFGGRISSLRLTEPFLPEPFEADRLMLSSLGGWLRSRGQWTPPFRMKQIGVARNDFDNIIRKIAIDRAFAPPDLAPPEAGTPEAGLIVGQIDIPKEKESLDLSEWVHLATQGRDHYVRIVYEGELWPFCHPAALIKVTERKFQENNGIVGAYLMQRMFIVVRKPEMRFADNDFGNPFKRVVLTTRVTPDIADPEPHFGHRSFWVQVMTGPAATDRVNFKFHAVGYDSAGGAIDFTVPMMFVSKSDLDAPEPIIAEFNRSENLGPRTCAVPGQKLSFVKPAAHANGNTQLATESLNFIMTDAVEPRLLRAAVRVRPVQELLGKKEATDIRLYPDYVKNGLPAGSATGVFAQIVQKNYSKFDPANPSTGLEKTAVDVAAEKAGGIATPNMAVTTLSKELGPLAGKVEDAVANTFNPAEFFPKNAAMLFGSFDLVDLFLPKPPPGQGPAAMTLDENAPQLTIENTGAAIVTKLDWKPKFLEPGGKLDIGVAAIVKDKGGKSTLEIHSTITKPIDPAAGVKPSAVFKGSLDKFTVSVLGSVFINFERFSFEKVDDKKPAVTVALDGGKPLEFAGDLAFIEEIRNAIPPGLFGDGASLDLVSNPLGIRAGFSFALPPITVAVFTLKDVKLGAALTLPFLEGKPTFDFNISERAHPFLLAVAIFGGGGFLHLQLDTAGMKALEVSLEFGATAAIDLGVASGEVHIMAGIYFSLQREEGTTELAAILSGYLRMGGSLSVLGIIKVSVEFNLSFTYDSARDKAYGRATLTVSVEVFMFSVSVELTVERAFGGSGDPHFIDFFPEPEPWEEYALAFA